MIKIILIVLGILALIRLILFVSKCLLGYVMCWGLRSFWEIVSEEFSDMIGR